MTILLEPQLAQLSNETADSRLFNISEITDGSRHVLSADQFSPERLEHLFMAASELRAEAEDPDGARHLAQRHIGRSLCSLFYEPSTRTRLSFETAAIKFGMGYVSTENAREFSSATKGETIEDTIQVLEEYGYAAIVLRHHETGAAARAAGVCKSSLINAGDGKGEHPTQALLDTYTIQEQLGTLDGLRVVLGGDLKHGRTVRSLAQLLAKYKGNHLTFVSTPELQMGDDVKQILRSSGTVYEETTDMPAAFQEANVVYWTRLQKERHEKPKQPQTRLCRMRNFAQRVKARETPLDVSGVKGGYIIDRAMLEFLPEHAIIMHPLPRDGEIHPEVDSDHRAQYFRQAGNGLYVRMALIDALLKAN